MAEPAPQDVLITTRRSLHALAEHVLAGARHAATGRIGLEVVAAGIATPPFPGPDGSTVVSIEGTNIVVRDDNGERRQPVTTIGDAAAFVGIEPGAPASVYPPTTAVEDDEPLGLDAPTAASLMAWLTTVTEALERFVAELEGEGVEAAPITLWPEHFDVATVAEEVNYGGSPGDDDLPRAYAYVGPHRPRRGAFWNERWGAARPAGETPTTDAVLTFFRDGRVRAQHDPVTEGDDDA